MLSEKNNSFRFVDEQLQASLVSAIKSARLTCEVASDGTVIYPHDYSIEEFINPIVETVFPDGYYRTEISDSIKAERYRRFKKYRGTPLIEEIRDGKSHFVQGIYEKLYRNGGIPTHVCFILADEALDPNTITSVLGVSPTFACLKGEPFARPYTKRGRDAPLRPSRTGWWELCSIPHVESNAVELHMDWLFRLLEPIVSEIKSLSERLVSKDFRVLQVDIVEPTGCGGISMPSRMLEQLTMLTDRVDIRIWPDDSI